MPDPRPHPFSTWEDSGFSLMSRIQGEDGENITQSSINTITASFFNIDDTDDPQELGFSPIILTVSQVVFDTLQTDARWTKDATGYNFRYDVPKTVAVEPCKMRVEILFDPASGENFYDVWEGTVRAIHAT